MANGEQKILESWKLKIGLLMAIITPTTTAVGAYFRLESKIQEAQANLSQRVSSVELDTSRSFADKNDLKEMRMDIKQMREDISEIKSSLRRR